MIEVFPNLYVGSQTDLIHVDDGKKGIKDGWFVVTAARDPWHREALGYTGRGAPKDHADYLFTVRERRTILNLIDGADPAYVRDEVVTMAMQSINTGLTAGKVLIHCNQGGSRAPGLALLWLHGHPPSLAGITEYSGLTLDAAEAKFKAIYPDYAPAAGIRGYLAQHWD